MAHKKAIIPIILFLVFVVVGMATLYFLVKEEIIKIPGIEIIKKGYKLGSAAMKNSYVLVEGSMKVDMKVDNTHGSGTYNYIQTYGNFSTLFGNLYSELPDNLYFLIIKYEDAHKILCLYSNYSNEMQYLGSCTIKNGIVFCDEKDYGSIFMCGIGMMLVSDDGLRSYSEVSKYQGKTYESSCKGKQCICYEVSYENNKIKACYEKNTRIAMNGEFILESSAKEESTASIKIYVEANKFEYKRLDEIMTILSKEIKIENIKAIVSIQ